MLYDTARLTCGASQYAAMARYCCILLLHATTALHCSVYRYIMLLQCMTLRHVGSKYLRRVPRAVPLQTSYNCILLLDSTTATVCYYGE
eukprot:1258850-Rhodomonas_salina.4